MSEHPISVPSRQVTYASYLRVDELVALQSPLSEPVEHDEMLFIVIHQVYELWFKQLLHEIKHASALLTAADGARASATFKRMLTVLKTLVSQVDVLETMTPVQFSSFRSRLDTASGFQSRQFRQLEIALGKREPRMLEHLKSGDGDAAQVAAWLREPSLYDAFLRYLAANGIAVPEEVLGRDVSDTIPSSAALRGELVKLYRARPDLSAMCERMIDLDEGLQEWRYRHVKMVERTIGFKQGTGGSAGAEYLRTTLFRPLYPDLWDIRRDL